jgi:hypothetical protein
VEAVPSLINVAPAWHPVAVEDGEHRDLNEIEMAALVADLEQKLGGMTARFEPTDEG